MELARPTLIITRPKNKNITQPHQTIVSSYSVSRPSDSTFRPMSEKHSENQQIFLVVIFKSVVIEIADSSK